MKSKQSKRPKLSTFLKARGWQFDGFLQCSRVFKFGYIRVVVENDDHSWTMTVVPDHSGQISGKGKPALIALLREEEQRS